MLNPGEDPRQMEQEVNIWKLRARWRDSQDGTLGRAAAIDSTRLSLANGTPVVFLAGDAAHQQPPFIGQGMCQGLRDITNLCWKLVSVLKGTATDELLDSYEQERSEHVRTLTQRIKQIGATICERDPQAARRRDQALLAQGGGKACVVTRQEIVPPLQSGFLALNWPRQLERFFLSLNSQHPVGLCCLTT
jgi:3-(3-hydroxy-phenyl)propionate hydroxylase